MDCAGGILARPEVAVGPRPDEGGGRVVDQPPPGDQGLRTEPEPLEEPLHPLGCIAMIVRLAVTAALEAAGLLRGGQGPAGAPGAAQGGAGK